jgi:hypothetical protein
VTKRQDSSAEKMKKPDFGRGQRTTPANPGEGSDFAKGERTLRKSDEERKRPDFAEGERVLPKPDGEHSDFGKGMEQDTSRDAGGGQDHEED